jgi:hypothetical protein
MLHGNTVGVYAVMPNNPLHSMHAKLVRIVKRGRRQRISRVKGEGESELLPPSKDTTTPDWMHILAHPGALRSVNKRSMQYLLHDDGT